jgi:hypothetical protein
LGDLAGYRGSSGQRRLDPRALGDAAIDRLEGGRQLEGDARIGDGARGEERRDLGARGGRAAGSGRRGDRGAVEQRQARGDQVVAGGQRRPRAGVVVGAEPVGHQRQRGLRVDAAGEE